MCYETAGPECGLQLPVHLLSLGFEQPLELILELILGDEHWPAESGAWLGLGLAVSIALIMLIMVVGVFGLGECRFGGFISSSLP